MGTHLFNKFVKSIDTNNRGGLSCYLRRVPVLPAILLQKLKVNKVVKVPLFFGENMHVVTGETVSSHIISFGYAEIALTALMLKALKAGDTFVDVGTHFGYEALLASTLVGTQGSVTSFEPNLFSHSIATLNLKNANTRLFNYAVGSYDGVAKMLNHDVSGSAFNSVVSDTTAGNVVEVEIKTLDTALAGRAKPIDFIKCDVEGLEVEVINGAAGILKQDKPLVVLEADMPEDGKPSARALELEKLMGQFGYLAYNFELDGEQFKVVKLGSLPASHANILFVHESKQVDFL